MDKKSIAIIGGSGLVGQSIIKVLCDENMIENLNITLYVSSKSAGKEICVCGKNYKLRVLDESALSEKYDIVFFSAGDDISEIWAERFADTGAYVIDNSNAFRKKEYVPLVVPEININMINANTKIISNPNCSTIQLALSVDRLIRFAKSQDAEIDKIVVSTYQAVSGAGKEALDELTCEHNNYFNFDIKKNVVLKIGDICENGFCVEENKIMFEINKILQENISICASTVRVPIPNCHSESVYVKFTKNVDFMNIKDYFYTQYLKFEKDIVLQSDVTDSNLTYISRLRKFSDNEITYFVVADNLIRGAAFNAVMISKYILSNLLT